MTLFEFLKKVRAEGADISKMEIRIKDFPGGWGHGFKIHTLRGNRLSIETTSSKDFQLTPGHLAMRSKVVGIRRIKNAVVNRILPAENLPIMMVDLEQPIGH